ncbi:unnamed protein product [Microthlaspi erraticum]|uniref:RING-type domain-containing protein n=1 Tax=Microthlaspi erraticum TaxID=1685480 RepID=A0A6D2J112_9BRAS|nr:unnamed protein product [Microthlaspi erraticum]
MQKSVESTVQVTIDIVAKVSRESRSASNTVEISLTREIEELFVRNLDGNVVHVGSNIAPPFPIPNLRLNSIATFDPRNIYPRLYSTLQDPNLCDTLSAKIASEAEQVAAGPLNISLDVTLTPHRVVSSIDQLDEMEEEETCAICKEDLFSTGDHFSHLPNCSHRFHVDCIMPWLETSLTCPLCRTVVELED